MALLETKARTTQGDCKPMVPLPCTYLPLFSLMQRHLHDAFFLLVEFACRHGGEQQSG